MAVVFLVCNGVGLGHHVRAIQLCHVLAEAGERPVVFSQGVFPLDERAPFPGRTVPKRWEASATDRLRVANEVRSMAEISLPAAVVEDTHPHPFELSPEVRRILVVRPTTFTCLTDLNDRYADLYSAFLLGDMPGSLTWPYSDEETAAIAAWPRWTALGPVYRRPTPEMIAEVRARHRIDERRLCVLSMGGGGLHRPTDPDAQRFVKRGSEVADALLSLDPEARVVFVAGPHFPAGVTLDERFEVIDQEPRMPALLALAHAAVIRPGFNTVWECVAAGVPFLHVVGTTYEEPNVERLERLRACEMLDDDIERIWCDDRWRAGFRRRCESAVERFPGAPVPGVLQTLVTGPRRSSAVGAGGPSRRLRQQVAAAQESGQRGSLLIRVDDVIAPEGALEWLLEELAARRLRASLEVVPYLSELDEATLDAFDPAGEFFEVSQHGWAHIVKSDSDGRKHEFAPKEAAPTPEEEQMIHAGRSVLRNAFPRRFRGGFSPPFDALPGWLPSVWYEARGAFVSHIGMPPRTRAPLPLLRLGIDIWDWSRRAPRPVAAITAGATADLRAHDYTGIVIHPHRLRQPAAREHLRAVLDALVRRGLTPASLQEMAARLPRGVAA